MAAKLDPWKNNSKKIADYSPEQLKALESRIREAVFKMLLNHGFFGIMALRLERVWTDDIPTAATDGRRIYFNPGFVEALTNSELIFLVVHELYHCVFEHFLRRGSRVPQWWNMAGDYVINYICQRDNMGTLISNILIDKKYAGWFTEQVYEDLEKQAAKFLDTIDVHLDADGTKDGEGKPKEINGQGFNDGEKVKGGGKLSPDEAKKVRDEIRGAIIQAAKAAGNVPGEIKRIIDEFTKPQIRWQQLLESTIASKIRSDTSFSRPDRKSWSNASRIVFPGDLPGNQINLAISIDNSGSITDAMLKEFLSEVHGIMTSYNAFNIKLWCFDTQVSGLKEYTEETADELVYYEFTGGGGTAIAVNWQFMLDNEIEADIHVCFTDLYSSDLDDINPNQIDTVWIISSNPNGRPPFGRYAYYEHGKE